MKNLELGVKTANDTKSLALRAVQALSDLPSACRLLRVRTRRPVDYMRYAEFEAVRRDLKPKAGMKILDVSSPQWFSLCLANQYPDVEFHYLNIIESEINPYREVAQALNLNNLTYAIGDVRDLQFSDHTFDGVVSISVIEHIYPEDVGDLNALSEIYRVLKAGGEFLMTVPYKTKGNILYTNAAVYERREQSRNFFAREYDQETLNRLINQSPFSLAGLWFICEQNGLFPLDYYEWGPGKNNFLFKHLVKSRKLFERLLGTSLDEALAQRYLQVSRELTGRPVNVSAKLLKTIPRSLGTSNPFNPSQ